MYKISLIVYKMSNLAAKQILNREESHIHPGCNVATNLFKNTQIIIPTLQKNQSPQIPKLTLQCEN